MAGKIQEKLLGRLEKEKKQYKRNLDYLMHEIQPQHEKIFQDQQGEVAKTELETKIEHLTQELQNLKCQYNETPIKNPRGAGRKPKLNQIQIQEMKALRQGGLTISELSKLFHCSAGLVHKLINEECEI